jgi:hypothetical protein
MLDITFIDKYFFSLTKSQYFILRSIYKHFIYQYQTTKLITIVSKYRYNSIPK